MSPSKSKGELFDRDLSWNIAPPSYQKSGFRRWFEWGTDGNQGTAGLFDEVRAEMNFDPARII